MKTLELGFSKEAIREQDWGGHVKRIDINTTAISTGKGIEADNQKHR